MTIDIDAIKERCEAATPGPWVLSDDERIPARIHAKTNDLKIGGKQFLCTKVIAEMVYQETDARFIAHARQDIPELLTAYEEQAAEIERLNEELCRAKFLADAMTKMYAAADRDYVDSAKDRDAWKARAEETESRIMEMTASRDSWMKSCREEVEQTSFLRKARAEEYEDRMRLEKERDEWRARVEELEKTAQDTVQRCERCYERLESHHSDLWKKHDRLAAENDALVRAIKKNPNHPCYACENVLSGGVDSPCIPCIYNHSEPGKLDNWQFDVLMFAEGDGDA